MVQRCLLLVVLACGVVACGGDSDDDKAHSRACEVIGLNTRVLNGDSCDDIARSPVVRIITRTIRDGIERFNPVCTGTMVTPNVVLTAAHCISANRHVLEQGIYVGEPGAGIYVSGIRYSIAPGFHNEPSVDRLFNDAALILLERNVNLPLVPVLLSRTVQVGEPGFVYGYGVRKPGEDADFFTLEAGTMTVKNVTPNHIFVEFSGSGVNVCNGDSGGPLIVEVDGQPATAGVVSQGTTEQCTAGDVTTFTNLQSPNVLQWLVNMVPNAYARHSDPNWTAWTN